MLVAFWSFVLAQIIINLLRRVVDAFCAVCGSLVWRLSAGVCDRKRHIQWLFSQNHQSRSLIRIPPLHSVRQEAVLRTEYSFCTGEGGFRYRISPPYRRSLFFAQSAFENASRTPGGYFLHRMSIPYTRGPSPVPNVPMLNRYAL